MDRDGAYLVGVHMDIENCPFPNNFPVRKAYENINFAVRQYITKKKIRAICIYAKVNLMKNERKKELCNAGFSLITTPSNLKEDTDIEMITEIFQSVYECSTPAYIMIFTGDANFTHTIKALRRLRYTVILGVPENSRVNTVLRNSSHFLCSFSSLCTQGVFVNPVFPAYSSSSSSSSSSSPLSLCLIEDEDIPEPESNTNLIKWDMIACPLSKGISYETAVSTLREWLEPRQLNEEWIAPTFHAYEGTSELPSPLSRERCEQMGVVFFDQLFEEIKEGQLEPKPIKYEVLNKRMIVDMFEFAHNNRPPGHIMVITNDDTISPALLKLEDRGHTLKVVVPNRVDGLGSFFDNELLHDWDDLLRLMQQQEQ